MTYNLGLPTSVIESSFDHLGGEIDLLVGISEVESESSDLKDRCIASYAIFPYCREIIISPFLTYLY